MSTFLWILSGTALVGATILLWGRYEYLKQKRIGEELDRERAEIEQQLIEKENERVRLEKVQEEVKPSTLPVEQMVKDRLHLFKEEVSTIHTHSGGRPTEIIYPMSRAQAAPTMKPSPSSKPKRTTTSVSSAPKVKSTPKTTSRSSYRRDDDDYNNSTVLGSTWGSSSSWGSSNSCGSSSSDDSWGSSSSSGSSSSWGSDSSSSGSSSDSGSWCD